MPSASLSTSNYLDYKLFYLAATVNQVCWMIYYEQRFRLEAAFQVWHIFYCGLYIYIYI